MAKVLFPSPYSVDSVSAFSGVNYHLFRSFGRLAESCTPLAPMRESRPLWQQILTHLPHSLFPWRFLPTHTRQNARCLGRQVEKALIGNNYDAILSPSTLPIMELGGRLPVCIYTDATVACLAGYYESFSHIPGPALRVAHRLEKQALDRATHIVFTSSWACAATGDFYGISANKMSWIPRGANFASDMDRAEVISAIRSRPLGSCNLLFVGANWVRKGGPVAVAVAKWLNEAGMPTLLHVVGCRPDIPLRDRSVVKVHGYLDKADARELELLKSIFASSHFFVLPTQAEAMGISFCEASSFGVPSLARNTGGVSAAVRDGVNGFLFAANADASSYAAAVLRTLRSRQEYDELALSTYALYERELNWVNVAKRIHLVVQSII